MGRFLECGSHFWESFQEFLELIVIIDSNYHWANCIANYHPQPQEIPIPTQPRHCLINLSLRQIDAKGGGCCYLSHAPTMPVRHDAVHLYLRDSDCPCELFFWVQEATGFCERFFEGFLGVEGNFA